MAGWWWLAALGLIAAIFVAYRGAVLAPFVLDDSASVTDNPTIRSLWPLSGPLAPPPGGVPVSGRPLPNLSFALNYAISGTEVWSYHLGNIALHLLTALTLCSLLRRTLARPVLPEDVLVAAPRGAGFVGRGGRVGRGHRGRNLATTGSWSLVRFSSEQSELRWRISISASFARAGETTTWSRTCDAPSKLNV